MKVFWRDPDGNPPPHSAIFSYCPFIGTAPTPFENVTQILDLPKDTPPIRTVKHTFTPSYQEWVDNIKSVKMNKVVLARCCEYECELAPDPFAVTAALLKKAKNSTVFCFSDGESAFLGATPEILFSREKNVLQTEALAGTCLREDDESAFLHSTKDMSEINPVIDYLSTHLTPLCVLPPTFSPITTKQTPNLLHLHSKATAILHPTVTDTEIIGKIHPTPALCGLPKSQALEFIKQKEPFQRGLYGGILGWQTDEKSTWIVAIRCCFIHKKTVKLYTGAGIVPLSDPQKEWEELNNKMALYKDIFIC